MYLSASHFASRCHHQLLLAVGLRDALEQKRRPKAGPVAIVAKAAGLLRQYHAVNHMNDTIAGFDVRANHFGAINQHSAIFHFNF